MAGGCHLHVLQLFIVADDEHDVLPDHRNVQKPFARTVLHLYIG